MQEETKEVVNALVEGKKPRATAIIIILLIILGSTVTIIINQVKKNVLDFKNDISGSVANVAESVNDLKETIISYEESNTKGHASIQKRLDTIGGSLTINTIMIEKVIKNQKNLTETYKNLKQGYYIGKPTSEYIFQRPIILETKTENKELTLNQEIEKKN